MLDVIGYIIAGALLVFIPGFLFALVLYPKMEDMDFWVRVGSSFGLGAMVMLYEAYAIARVGSLTIGAFIIAVAVTSGALLFGVYIRKGGGVVSAYWKAFIKGVGKIFSMVRKPKPAHPSVSPDSSKAEEKA
ncbi:MAG: hypothetical protein AB1476_04470 [Candidatus Hadarchaeota archaeon]